MALAAASCSDPPPTPSAVGFSISLSPPSASEVPNLGSRSCGAMGSGAYTYMLGQPSPNKTVEDGKNGVSVDCTVRADGTFTARAVGADTNSKQKISINVSGRIVDKTMNSASNTGTMVFYTPDTFALRTGGDYPGCTFGPVPTLKKGAILTDVHCPIIASDTDTSGGCKVDGTFAFEYCKTGEEEN